MTREGARATLSGVAAARSNRRLLLVEAVLTPASIVGLALLLHFGAHQRWVFAVPAGIVISGLVGLSRWWQWRR